MKTRKHGNGLSHADVVRFSNILAGCSMSEPNLSFGSDVVASYYRGWNDACKYFAHSLRVMLRDVERYEQEI